MTCLDRPSLSGEIMSILGLASRTIMVLMVFCGFMSIGQMNAEADEVMAFSWSKMISIRAWDPAPTMPQPTTFKPSHPIDQSQEALDEFPMIEPLLEKELELHQYLTNIGSST